MERTGFAEEDREKAEFSQETNGIGRACMVAVIAGILIGIVGAAFRVSLSWMGAKHTEFVLWAKEFEFFGWLLPIAFGALGAALARLLVRRQPLSSGSGVQHVEAIMRGEAEPASIEVVPIKYLGGLLAIGAGMALGREGPTIQIGATIGAWVANILRCTKEVMHDLQAALGGAGLAVAFNAPMGGTLFVFEEVAHSFRLRLTIVTLVATAIAITVSRMITGGAPVFEVANIDAGPKWILVLFCLFGAVTGLLAVVYNRLTIFGLQTLEKIRNWPPELRAALIGALTGLVAWFAPALDGSGEEYNQLILHGGLPLTVILIALVVRWFLGPICYSAGVPGGLFAPLLLVGAALGAAFAGTYNIIAGAEVLSPVNFAVAGMAAFFTGCVRAPITGTILIAEMTGTPNLIVPISIASLGAMLSATLVKGEPIYDTLRRRMLMGLRR